MHDNDRFIQTYLALVALNWRALERIDELLSTTCPSWMTPHVEGLLQWLRLELLQLDDSVSRCSHAQRLSAEQRRQMQELVRTLLDWLDFEPATVVEVVRLRLGAAQNWLLEEASRSVRLGNLELSRRRG